MFYVKSDTFSVKKPFIKNIFTLSEGIEAFFYARRLFHARQDLTLPSQLE
jgi:hypothetical protein